MLVKLLQLYVFILASNSLAQQILINGKVVDSLGIIKNANIINLKTNQGTFSSDDGTFRIYVSQGDSLRISSIQYVTETFYATKQNINNKKIIIKLKPTTYVLDEFELKKHNLTGRLGIDLKEVPTNKRDSLLRNVMDFSNVNLKRAEEDDYIDKRVRPQKVETDPTQRFGGVGTKITIPFKNKESILRKELNRKKAVPDKILSELGEQFFFQELKIPKDNYFHFLDYCNSMGIEKLYNEGEILELIKIFQKESVPYLQIIKKE
ncbi:carboxypeptidase-like regulatory domain-containing protein [Polaribacter sp. 20A6]|uniref:carboxypeptidase-like regulatory domain-containing protein n=1 Tax=Polaribacter sp. 20A6 TaxID=2687289 RepID=UPI0013FD81FA|nr:carboxypeptidase-like regulatory domain-containing protein [Polaribacter sp. 20A6]